MKGVSNLGFWVLGALWSCWRVLFAVVPEGRD